MMVGAPHARLASQRGAAQLPLVLASCRRGSVESLGRESVVPSPSLPGAVAE